jgi:hypothetical protein
MRASRTFIQGLEVTICVKRDPIGICLAIPDSALECDVDPFERHVSCWRDSYLKPRTAPRYARTISNVIAYAASPEELTEPLDWNQFFLILTPAWLSGRARWKKTQSHRQFFLGSVVTRGTRSLGPSSTPVAYIPGHSAVRIKEWTVGPPPKSACGHRYNPERDLIWQR